MNTRDSLGRERKENLLYKHKSSISEINDLEAMKTIHATPISLASRSDVYESVNLYLVKMNRLNSDSNLCWTNILRQHFHTHITSKQ